MADDKFLKDRSKTWKGFLWLISVSAVLTIVTLAVLAYFLL